MKNLEELFEHTLKDIYYAEKQITKALPKMAKKADSAELRKAFEMHLKETEGHIQNLEDVFKIIGKRASGDRCPAIEGIIEEGEEIMEDTDDADTLDAAMIAAAQAVEHYEITRYGTLIAWAKQLGLKDAVKLFDANIKQEYAADDKLTKLAEAKLNKQAA